MQNIIFERPFFFACFAVLIASLELNAPCADTLLQRPNAIVRLPDGRLFVSDLHSNSIYEIATNGSLSRWAGNGKAGYSGDGGVCTEAMFNAPMDLKLDLSGRYLLVADANNHRIRKINLDSKKMETIIGDGNSQLRGDGGLATQASLNNPQGIALDKNGNIYVADTFNHVVRIVSPSGVISTFAGSEPGLAGDGGMAAKAQLNMPMAVACSLDDPTVYISDAGNSRIRRVDADGIIRTVCGVGEGSGEGGAGFSGDGDLATKSKIFSPMDLIAIRPNFFYFSDSGNHRIRVVAHGMILSIAGKGNPSDGKLTTQSDSTDSLYVPAKMTLGDQGDLYFCDRGNGSIRHLSADGKLTTIPLR